MDTNEEARKLLTHVRALRPIDAARALTIHEWFEATAERTPEAVAVIDPGNGVSQPLQMTYAELNRRANQLAHVLISRGAGPEDLVAVLLRRSPEMIVAILGILKAGAAYLPLDPVYPRERLAHIVGDAAAKWIITEQALANQLPEDKPACLDMDIQREEIAAHPEVNPTGRASESNLAYVIYTSGSTGRPKGTEVVHRNVIRLLRGTQGLFGFDGSDTWTFFHSLAFDFSVWEIWGALLNGGRLLLVGFEASRTPSVFHQLLRMFEVTVLNQTPSAFRQLIHCAEEFGFSADLSLKWVIFGGEALDPLMLRPWVNFYGDDHPRLINMYGITETTVHVTYQRILHKDLEVGKCLIGRPIPGWQVYILDEIGLPTPDGVTGEFYVGGDGVARGYLKRPDLTTARFLPDPFTEDPSARLYRTGDLGRRLVSGELEYLGRCDSQVKIRGYRIELGEITSELLRLEGIGQVAVIDRQRQPNHLELVAYLVPSPGRTIDLKSVRSALEERLPDYMIPAGWVQLAGLPLTLNGKLDRQALPPPQWEPDIIEPPQSPAEDELCRLFASALGIEKVGRNHHFFHSGGDSIQAMRLLGRLSHQQGKNLPFSSLFESPTPSALAARLNAIAAGTQELAPRAKGTAVPLAPSQEGLWFLDRLQNGSRDYNIPWSVRIKGPLNLPILEECLQQLGVRHESLRTRIEEIDGIPRQIIEPHIQLPMQRLDWSSQSSEVAAQLLEDFLRIEAQTPFELRVAPLIRFTLIQFAPELHVLSRTTHHIVSDGWSELLLDREIGELYSATVRGRPNPLPPLHIQFPDYCEWKRQQLTSRRVEELLAYWKPQLAGIPEETTLPMDRPRTPRAERVFDHVRLVLSPMDTEEFRTFAIRSGGTLYTGLVCAFSLLVGQYSGKSDIPLGTAAAGRDNLLLEAVLGFFVNTLVLRVRTTGFRCFSEFIATTQSIVLEALDHQDLPFQTLVKALKPERQTNASPLFQVFFSLQSKETGPGAWVGCEVEAVGNRETLVRFDLELHATESGSGLHLDFLFDSALFDRWRIEQFSRHFMALLDGARRQPEAPLSSLEYLSSSDRRILTQEFNSTQHLPGGETFVERVQRQVRRNPDAIAIQAEEMALSYSAMDRQSNQLARLLLTRGVRKGDIVAISIPRSPLLIVALMAVWKLGGVYLPVDPGYPSARREAMVHEASPAQMIALSGKDAPFDPSKTLLMNVQEYPTVLSVLESREICELERGGRLCTNDAAYIIYTSGSTGRPKGIVVAHQTLLNLIEWHESEYDPGPVAQSTSISFDVSLQQIAEALLRGQTLVMLGDDDRADGVRFAATIHSHGVAHVFVPQILLEHLVDAAVDEGIQLPLLRGVYQAGESLRVTPKMRLFFDRHPNCQLHNHYGPAETHVVTGLTLDDSPGSWPSTPTIGRPIWNTTILILTPELSLAPLGVIGEIYVAGMGLAMGYLHQAARTAERFVANPFQMTAGSRMYRTGDLGRWRADGTIECLGRADHQVKIRGFRIETGEIEQALLRVAGIGQAAVIAHPNAANEPELIAYLVPQQGKRIDLEKLPVELSIQLPEYMIPRGWAVLERLPVTPNGKLDRRALPLMDQQSHRREPARSPEEREICQVFAALLGLETVGRNDSFFRLGGHSLLALRLMGQLRRRFAGELSVRILFETPTPAGLALRLGPSSAIGDRIPRQNGTGQLPLSINQYGLWLVDQLAGGSPEYNLAQVLELPGHFDLDALARAVKALVARHEVLRTRFEPGESTPYQVVEPEVSVPLRSIDLEDMSLEQFYLSASRRGDQEVAIPFHLKTGPLIRFILLRGPEGRNLLLRICHHIVTDGWSEGILTDELAVLYAAFAKGAPNPLTDLPIQYADFCLWQRARLSPEWIAGRLPLWRHYLADIPQHLEWTTDYPRPSQSGSVAGVVIQRWSPDRLAGIKSIAAVDQVTLFAVLLTLYSEVVSRDSGQDRFVVGSPTAGRVMPELEPLVGFFVNILPIAIRLRPDAPFSEQIVDTQRSVLWAMDHQEIPLSQLVETLSDGRRPGISPLFQTLFALQNANQQEGNSRIIGWTVRDMISPLVRFDLEVHVYEKNDELVVQWLYRRELFRPERIEQLAGHFDRLAQKACSQPTLPLARHSLLEPTEMAQLLSPVQSTFPMSTRATVHEVFETQVVLTPDATAVVDGETTLSYHQLNIAANRLAHRLLKEGIAPGMVIGIWGIRGWELIVGLLGILKCGCTYLPLDTGLPSGRLTAVLKQARPWKILRPGIESQAYPDSGLPELVFPSSSETSQRDDNPTNRDRAQPVTMETAAYLVFTSGSTGAPKGVVATHHGIVRLVREPNYMRLDSTVRMLQLAPVSFDAATLEIWGPLLNGGTLVMAPPGLLSLSEISRCLLSYGVNTLWLTAGLFHAMVDAELESLGGLTQLLAGGDVLSPEHVRKFRLAHPLCRLINGYGPTEITTFATCHAVQDEVQSDTAIPIGRPINETAVYVLDRGLNLVPSGMVGEIYLGGAGLALGYADAPSLTAERFVANPYSRLPGERMYRSGDLGRWRRDGTLEFLGRTDHQLKIRGFRIELGEIEMALRQLPGVGQGVVVPQQGNAADVRLVAYIVPTPGNEIEWHILRAVLTRQLPDYMIPSAVVVLDALPLTPNGKLDRSALPIPQTAAKSTESPQNSDELAISREFASVLGISNVGRSDDFFQLGGHSLLAVRLVAAIQRRMGIDLPAGSVMRHPTPAGIAVELAKARLRKIEQAWSPTSPTTIWFDTLPWALEDWPSDLPVTGKSFPNIPVEEWTVHHNSASARLYVDHLREWPLTTPLLVGGYCRIGLIAFETACQLTEAGRPPAGIILVDTLPPSWFMRCGRSLALFFGRMLGATPGQIALKACGFLRYLALIEAYLLLMEKLMRRRWKEVVSATSQWKPFATVGIIPPVAEHERRSEAEARILAANDYWQLSDFEIRRFEGPVLLLISRDTPSPMRRQMVRRWAKHCPNLMVEETPGDHESCIRKDAGGLARRIAQFARGIFGFAPPVPLDNIRH